jgi:hypothetical protein
MSHWRLWAILSLISVAGAATVCSAYFLLLHEGRNANPAGLTAYDHATLLRGHSSNSDFS